MHTEDVDSQTACRRPRAKLSMIIPAICRPLPTPAPSPMKKPAPAEHTTMAHYWSHSILSSQIVQLDEWMNRTVAAPKHSSSVDVEEGGVLQAPGHTRVCLSDESSSRCFLRHTPNNATQHNETSIGCMRTAETKVRVCEAEVCTGPRAHARQMAAVPGALRRRTSLPPAASG